MTVAKIIEIRGTAQARDESAYYTCVTDSPAEIGRLRQTAQQRGFEIVERRIDPVDQALRFMRGDA